MTELEILELFKYGDFPDITPENEPLLQSAMVRVLLNMKNKAVNNEYTITIEKLMEEVTYSPR